jgi:hypothetical protein
MTEPTLRSRFDRFQRGAFGVALVAGLAVAYGFTQDRRVFFQSWLLGYLYWIALPLGSLALVMLHHMTGGSWGFAIRRLLENAMRTLPLFALLFVPIALGIHDLYEWSHADVVANDPVLQHKSAYLNSTGFLVRAAVYFVVWSFLAWRLLKLSERHDRVGGTKLVHKMRVVAGPGIALYGIAMTFAAIDWGMSLEPHWFSTIYGVMFLVGQVLTTLAFAVATSAWISRREPFTRWLKPDHYHDLGKLMFAFVLLWAYVAFSQFLIIWSANVGEETPWYLKRIAGGWDKVALFVIVFHFALPFLVLLSRAVKRNAALLASIAVFLLVLRLVDLFWLIVPAFAHGEPTAAHLEFHWMYVATPVAIGGLWLGVFVQQLKGRPLISLHDAQLERALERTAAEASHG